MKNIFFKHIFLQELVHHFFLHFIVIATKIEKQNVMKCLNKIGFYALK